MEKKRTQSMNENEAQHTKAYSIKFQNSRNEEVMHTSKKKKNQASWRA